MGLPAVIGGWLVVHGGGLVATSREYGAAVIVLAGLALLGLARRTPEMPTYQAISDVHDVPSLATTNA